MAVSLYSIGYATKPIDEFIAQLQQNQIAAVADVRSVPFSKAFFDYHQDAIRETLKKAGIYYVYLGDELGPRSKDPRHYDERGQVQFDRLQASALFLEGVARLDNGIAKGMRIALMCAEKDPAVCHRSLLIGHYWLRKRSDVPLMHICHDGALESQAALEARITEMHSTGQDLFMTACECASQAFAQQLKAKAYRKPDTPNS